MYEVSQILFLVVLVASRLQSTKLAIKLGVFGYRYIQPLFDAVSDGAQKAGKNGTVRS